MFLSVPAPRTNDQFVTKALQCIRSFMSEPEYVFLQSQNISWAAYQRSLITTPSSNTVSKSNVATTTVMMSRMEKMAYKPTVIPTSTITSKVAGKHG